MPASVFSFVWFCALCIVFYSIILSKRLCLIPTQFFHLSLLVLLFSFCSQSRGRHRVLENVFSLPACFFSGPSLHLVNRHGYLSGLISKGTSSKKCFLTHFRSLFLAMNQKYRRWFLEYAFLVAAQWFLLHSDICILRLSAWVEESRFEWKGCGY